MYNSTVVEHHRLREDIAVVRLEGDFVPFRAGQSVEISIPQRPLIWRKLSPALPPSRDGKLEFHIRAIPSGWLSPAVVEETRPGDVWQIRNPFGRMHIPEKADKVVMFAGGTGLAPLRALILEASRRPTPPQVHLFFGGRSERDMYAEDMLILLSQQFPWLRVVRVLSDPNLAATGDHDLWWERVRNSITLPPGRTLYGSLAGVARAHGAFTDQQVLVCGSLPMTSSTVEALLQNGTPKANISFDPPD